MFKIGDKVTLEESELSYALEYKECFVGVVEGYVVAIAYDENDEPHMYYVNSVMGNYADFKDAYDNGAYPFYPSELKPYNDEIKNFLSRVGNGYIELSHDKIMGEYLYFKKRAKELLDTYYLTKPVETNFKDDF